MTYECPTNPDYSEIQYKPVSNIIDFINMNTDELKSDYENRIPALIAECLREKDKYELWGDYYNIFRELDCKYPFLIFYNHFFLFQFYAVHKGEYIDVDSGKIMEELHVTFLRVEGSIREPYYHEDKNYDNLDNYFRFVIKNMMDDIRVKQKIVKEEAERIHEHFQNADFQRLSPQQKLYFLDRQNPSKNFAYTNSLSRLTGNSTYNISLIPRRMLHSGATTNDTFAASLYDDNFTLFEAYTVMDIVEWIKLEFYKMIMNYLSLEKCQYCQNFFIPYGRKDVKYCNRIKEGEEQPCNIIGPGKVYQEKIASDKIYAAFQRAYKRMYGRHYNGKMSEKTFTAWSKEAQRKRQECQDGIISLKEFEDWLGNKRK